MQWMIAISFILSLACSLLLVRIVRAFARTVGLVDRPDAERKVHEKPVALAGGVAVFLSVATTFALSLVLDRTLGYHVLGTIQMRWYVLFGAALAILVVGLVDDVWSLRGRQKLLLQIVIIGLMIGAGTQIHQIGLFGYEISLGVFSIPVTMLWLLLAVNALNLIDGADGMASTVGMIIAIGLGILGFVGASPLSGVVGFALAGALLGFLVYNKPPASIYLGDAGSMMIGLFVGTLAIWSNLKESTVLASAPMAILAIPLFDSSAAIVRRRLTGRSIYATDRGHMHHLLQLKYGPHGLLIVVGLACLVTTVVAVLGEVYSEPWWAMFGVILVIAVLIQTRSFGHSEARLIFNRAAHFIESFFMHPERCEQSKQHRRLQLQGDAPWELVWEPLVEFAKKHDLAKMKVNISMPWLHESYHATWQSVRLPERAQQMVMEVPLFAERQNGDEMVDISVGKLELVALGKSTAIYQNLEDFLTKLDESKAPITKIMLDLERRQLKGKGAAVATVGRPETETSDTVASLSGETAEQPPVDSESHAVSSS
ncbi:glycosyltransferase family 4 protein [Crateriforma conspicua]|uniref:glycosyltransferase family 4 protein n=1 Tax=Crateriforma conspicua TaxID=2527996 RepID=UPI00118CA955|nr:MraY family glycosyltransferase [Crateriforma conspicua]QDV64494.1 WecA-like glycosyltransferase [Crateriforma conspicua]